MGKYGGRKSVLSAWLRQSTASMKLPAAGTRRAATALPEPRDSHQEHLPLPGLTRRAFDDHYITFCSSISRK
jgi:hypothetical protein